LTTGRHARDRLRSGRRDRRDGVGASVATIDPSVLAVRRPLPAAARGTTKGARPVEPGFAGA